MEEEQEGEREKLDPVSRFLLLGEPAPLELLAKTAHRDPKFEKLLLSGLRRPQMEKRKRNRLMSLALRQKCFSVAKILMRSGGVDINAPLKERRTGRANVVQGGGGGIGLSSPTRNASQVPTIQMAPLPIAPLSNRKGVSLGFQVKKQLKRMHSGANKRFLFEVRTAGLWRWQPGLDPAPPVSAPSPAASAVVVGGGQVSLHISRVPRVAGRGDQGQAAGSGGREEIRRGISKASS